VNELAERKKVRATIKEIAQRAGTSIATVSRVLRKVDHPVKPELREQVLQAAQELNYTPNLIGRFLKSSSSNDIGVIIPTISNPFYPLLILGIEEVFDRYGYNMLLCNSFRNEKKEMNYVELLRQKQVNGLIIASISSDREYLQAQIDAGLRVVTLDQSIENLNCSKVVIDYELCSQMAMEHLWANGHRKIGFISAPLSIISRKLIYSGYVKSLEKYQIPISPEWLYINDHETETNGEFYEFENGKNLARRLFETANRPTALLVINDMTAYGLMHELTNQNISIPTDISIISFDNIFFSQVTTPPLTTIGYSTYDMGRLAAECLIKDMLGEQSEAVDIVIKPELIERKSVHRLL
jgi:DNA-binding LacI/PurR family transcriptional regulator